MLKGALGQFQRSMWYLMVAISLGIFVTMAVITWQCYEWLSAEEIDVENLSPANHHAIYMCICLGPLLLLSGFIRFTLQSINHKPSRCFKVAIIIFRLICGLLFVLAISLTVHRQKPLDGNVHKIVSIVAGVFYVIHMFGLLNVLELTGLVDRMKITQSQREYMVEQFWGLLMIFVMSALSTGFYLYFRHFDYITKGDERFMKDRQRLYGLVWSISIIFILYTFLRDTWHKYSTDELDNITNEHFVNNFQFLCRHLKDRPRIVV